MKIKQITWRLRRDFHAIYECEHCRSEQKGKGYDDSYFHTHVIPDMKCKNCGKTSPETYSPQETKYPDGMLV